jgi:hypothetical protein
MFSQGRYVIVDDDPDQLRPLVDALHALGAPCLGVRYDANIGLADGQFRGVRILFMDLHLQGPATGKAANYALIGGLLEQCVIPASGLYILVLWTAHAEELAAFTGYIQEAVRAEYRPLAILGMDKKTYLAADKLDQGKLKADIEKAVTGDARLQALLSWEHDVLAAAGATLAEIGGLIKDEDRTLERYPRSLDGILSLLAVAAVGAQNAERDPRSAVNAALAPILADRILSIEPKAANAEIWQRAITMLKEPPQLDARQAARMNTMLHLALPEAEKIGPSDWGAVVALPDAEKTEEALLARFGVRSQDLFPGVFQVEEQDLTPSCRLCLVRIGAGCDYAQCKSGPVLYVLALLRPMAVARKKKPRLASDYTTVQFWMDSPGECFELIINARFQIAVADDSAAQWEPLFRLREQLLAAVANHAASYVTRPGILSFHAD